MTPATPAEYGAAWLDEHDPDWASRIDLAWLNLNNPCRCILGQLYSTNGRNGYKRFFDTKGEEWTYRLGFDVPDTVPADEIAIEFAELTAEWSRLVAARQAKPTTTPEVTVP